MTTEDLTARYLAKYISKGSASPGPSSQPGLLQRDGLITTTELAEFLSLPAKTLRDWRYTGVGPRALRIGRHVRYEPAEVRRWLVEDCIRQRSA
jgi:predicted DNA-binding transcriptional regulator AlpA